MRHPFKAYLKIDTCMNLVQVQLKKKITMHQFWISWTAIAQATVINGPNQANISSDERFSSLDIIFQKFSEFSLMIS